MSLNVIWHSLMTPCLLLVCRSNAEEKSTRFKKNQESYTQAPCLSHQYAQAVFILGISEPGDKCKRQQHRTWGRQGESSEWTVVWPQTFLSWLHTCNRMGKKILERNVMGRLYFTFKPKFPFPYHKGLEMAKLFSTYKKNVKKI